MSLIVKNLTKTFGSQNAVDDLSFEIGKGQILGFLGPNGAGKSTTMKIVSCYLSPTSGTAEVCGHDILTHPLEARRHIGYLPENNPLYLDMYVMEYLNFVASLHKIPKRAQRISEIIELTGLGKESHKVLGALSKGYRQRVGLAQAIMHNPDILILDEPTSGLDMNQLVDIRKLILDLGKEKTVILSTHIMQEVQALCDRVIIINNGKLVADDPIERLQERIRGEDRITLILKESDIDTSRFRNIDGLRNIEQHNQNITITASDTIDIRPQIFKTVVDNGWTLLEMKRDQMSVEHVFQKLTKTEVHD